MKYIITFFLLISIFNSCNKKKVILNVDNRGEPASLDPAKVHTVAEFNLMFQIYEGLLSYNPHSLNPEPAIAESYKITEDGKIYTFYLRKNAKWSDGIKINAYTFRDSWLRILDPKFEAPYLFHFTRYIIGAEEYKKGLIKETDVGIKALDEWTLQVKLKNPVPYFLTLMAFPAFFPVPLHIINKYGDKWTETNNIVNNGPFYVKEKITKNRIVLEKNNKYYDKDKVKLDKVIFYCIEDDNIAFEKYMNNELNYLDSIPADKVKNFINQKQTRYYPYLSVYYYRFNINLPPFDDINIRKAFYYAIDREFIVKEITKSGEIPAYGVVPDGFIGYNTLKININDFDNEVKKYLKQSKYKNLSEFKNIRLLFNKSSENFEVANYIKKTIKDKLNLDITFVEVDRNKYFEMADKLDFNIARAKWIGDYVDPNTFLEIFSSISGLAKTGWTNEYFDLLLKKANSELDHENRMKILEEAEKILINDCAIVPLYFYVKVYLVKDNVKGIYNNILNIHPLKEVYIRD